MILYLLIACDEFGFKSTVNDSALVTNDSSLPEPDFLVSELAPNWGPLAGGTSVAIKGKGFEGEVEVFFGNAPLEVTLLDDKNLLILTPPSNLEGGVDVIVRSAIGQQELNNGFVYSNDGPPDPIDTADTQDTQDTGTPATGLTGGLVEFWQVVYACPECFSFPANSNQQILAGAAFHSPTNGSWLQWLPPQQSCFSQYTPTPLSTGTSLGDWIYLKGSQDNIGLRYSSTSGYYENTTLDPSIYEEFQPFQLEIPDEEITIENALETPQTFTNLQPEGAFLIGVPNSFQQIFGLNNFTLTWGPSGTSDSIVLIVGFYNPQNGALNGNIVCHSEDTGGLVLDPTLLSPYSNNDLLSIEIYRMQFRESVLPSNGSTIQGIGALGLVGTGVFRN